MQLRSGQQSGVCDVPPDQSRRGDIEGRIPDGGFGWGGLSRGRAAVTANLIWVAFLDRDGGTIGSRRIEGGSRGRDG